MPLVEATWVGPSGWTLVDGTVLEAGVTKAMVGHDEAEQSDFWKVSKQKLAAAEVAVDEPAEGEG